MTAAEGDSLSQILGPVRLLVGGQHGRMGRVAGEVDPDAARASHPLHQTIAQGDYRQVGVPAQAVAKIPPDQLLAYLFGVRGRQVELRIAEMNHVQALLQQDADLVGHDRGIPQPMRFPFGHRVGAVDAAARATPLGFHPSWPPR